MRDLRILKETEKYPTKKKKSPTLIIVFMGILIFLALFFLFEEEQRDTVSPGTGLPQEEAQEKESFRSELTPGKMRIDSEKEPMVSQTEVSEKPAGPIPKKELTFLKTLKEEEKALPPLKIKKTTGETQQITPNKKNPTKTIKEKTKPPPPRKSTSKVFSVQVASFFKKSGAEELAGKLKDKGYEAYVVSREIPQRGRWYRVRIGHYPDRAEAKSVSNQIKRSEKLDAFVTSGRK